MSPVATRYLSTSELAERIGVKVHSLNRYALPEPDAVVGTIRGWLPATVDAWQAARPGRGNWGKATPAAPAPAPTEVTDEPGKVWKLTGPNSLHTALQAQANTTP